ncbi:alpha/beta hydrolase family protein [Egicoccus sp. AB-alg6-2]|uniref:alpha/beta hydrolase family protein n=1 Tax=Egicoccus sp. AB-alg6-2 TaxID=3242692 RepID=UPI00359EEE11
MRTRRYGSAADQVGDLWLPDGEVPDTGWPVVVLIHGGFWRHQYVRTLTEPLARDLARRGLAAWNLEYRRVPPPDVVIREEDRGGWPATLQDVADGVDRLGDLDAPVDLGRVAVVGHSAGGQLALWAAGRSRLPAGAVGAGPRVPLAAVVGLAPVADLRGGERAGMGNGAMADLLGGGSDTVPERWELADPLGLVGHGVPVLLVHGEDDESVPPTQTAAYADAVRAAGDEVEVFTGPADHMAVIDPVEPLWQRAATWLEERLGVDLRR